MVCCVVVEWGVFRCGVVWHVLRSARCSAALSTAPRCLLCAAFCGIGRGRHDASIGVRVCVRAWLVAVCGVSEGVSFSSVSGFEGRGGVPYDATVLHNPPVSV